ncbi:hypothetical protein GCM10027598_43460 [Amycolatopsis oliviviridis]|uniref:Uncharacterized protein n=1 Tax=Amycolatopsis oliviviridis TaxID=1471590 RepID=A0ABQ3LAP8_9PSEU|nr:hypothetical protein [Amycolatopsis oliviviridis]GHH09875.1 hypothetical protein GCM10017790_18380 [Amycolatopsis oliviviridis]
MARTARREAGGDALSELMRAAGAVPRRRGPRGPKHRAPITVGPGSGRLLRISALSAGGVVVGGLLAVLLTPADSAEVVPGTPLPPPSLTIAPQAIVVPDDAASSPVPSGPSGGSVAPPPPMTASIHGSETPSPTPEPEPEERQDPRAGHHDHDEYYDWYYGGGYPGGYRGGGRQPHWGG